MIAIKIITSAYYMPGPLLRVSYAINHLILTNHLAADTNYYYPYFTDKETSTDKFACLRSYG